MKDWFGTGSRYPFEILGASHITMLLIFTIVLFSIALASKWLHTHERFRQIMRYSLLVLLLLSEISYQLWAYVNGVWSLGRSCASALMRNCFFNRDLHSYYLSANAYKSKFFHWHSSCSYCTDHS